METTTTMQASEVVFEPNPKVALGQKLMFGFMGIVLAAGFHYFKTRDSFLKSAAIGVAVGVVLVLVLLFRNRNKGLSKLVLGKELLTIEDKQSRTVIPWSEVTKAVHYLHGENRWEFHVQERREPVRYALYGFLTPELKAMKDALSERIPCEEERTPMEGPRPIAA
jgi:uncharacterized MnhB-related membrane protein